ncbi:DUF6907 domain-containing protein [Nocardia ninae]|nr:hypothetical protein [Nocardia ninae]
MNDARANAERQCPSWCEEHTDHVDAVPVPPDRFQVHAGLKSTRPLSIYGLRALTTLLQRTDTHAGEPDSYAIELHVGEDYWLLLTPAEADYLAEQLNLLTAEVRRVPARKQEGSTD